MTVEAVRRARDVSAELGASGHVERLERELTSA